MQAFTFRPCMVVSDLPRALSFDDCDAFEACAAPMPLEMAAALQQAFEDGMLPHGIDVIPRPAAWFDPPVPDQLRSEQLLLAALRAYPDQRVHTFVAWDPEREQHVVAVVVAARIAALCTHPDPIVARAMLRGAMAQVEGAQRMARAAKASA